MAAALVADTLSGEADLPMVPVLTIISGADETSICSTATQGKVEVTSRMYQSTRSETVFEEILAMRLEIGNISHTMGFAKVHWILAAELRSFVPTLGLLSVWSRGTIMMHDMARWPWTAKSCAIPLWHSANHHLKMVGFVLSHAASDAVASRVQ